VRNRTNREALWDALEEGLIDLVATDHSPCPPSMKRREEGRWDLAWGGIASLGLALPVMWSALEQRGVGLNAGMERVGKWMGAETARLAGLAGRKGTLVSGADADFVVFNPATAWTVAPEHLHFRHKVSPYLGGELSGRVVETWLRGQQVYSGSGFVGEPRGRELVRR
jgi:allantoinase